MKRTDLNLLEFNINLIKSEGGGDYAVAFDPSYISKSGKCTPGVGRYWSGQAGRVKYGLDAACLAVCDKKLHTAFHLDAAYTPSPATLKASGMNLMSYYTEYVARHADRIKEFGGFVVADAYFGAKTFVKGLRRQGLHLVSILKSNAVLHYQAQSVLGTRKRGRPAQKGIRIDWKKLDTSKIIVVKEDAEMQITSGIVWSKSLRMKVRLVRVGFLKEDGSVRTTKLIF
jgi:DDE superfamily endonuclease